MDRIAAARGAIVSFQFDLVELCRCCTLRRRLAARIIIMIIMIMMMTMIIINIIITIIMVAVKLSVCTLL